MTLLDRVLDPPSYGYTRNGELYKPTREEILAEFFKRLNVARDRRNWLPAFNWLTTLSFAIPLAIWIRFYFSWPLLIAAFLYSMVLMGSHGTFWLHRYSTHRAFRFRNPFIRMLCRNLVIKTIPEETYAISHHVHHRRPELPGDPYNVHAGWLYCFLADVNHQALARDLSEKDYAGVRKLLGHTGVRLNSYASYLKWGSACHPAWTAAHFAANWAFWYGVFYLLGGHALGTALFGAAGVWSVGVRTYNYEGHGQGKDKRRAGSDFNREDLSVNQMWPGIVAGEWHNNHHLFPTGARSGFLAHQLDLPWILIRTLGALGAVHSYRNDKPVFLSDHYLPYLAGKKAGPGPSPSKVAEAH